MARKPEDKRLLEEYAFSHDRCALCWYRKYRPGRRMELHHLNGRHGKQCHDHRNLIMLCNTCHWGLHNRVPPPFDGLEPAHLLTAKKEEDGECDVEFIASLRRKKHLGYEPKTIPQAYLDERIENDKR